MPQTLLALCAILVFSIYNLSQHRMTSDIERTAVGSELEQVASTVARSALLDVTRLAFDEADVGTDALRTTDRGLTASDDLGPDADEATTALFDDVDDFNGFAEVRVGAWDEGPIRFSVMVSVRYVEPDTPDAGASAPTLAKEVVVTVVEEGAPAGGHTPVTCTLRHVLTPAYKFFNG